MENKTYAGFWIRSAAALIDIAIFLVITGIILSVIYGYDYWDWALSNSLDNKWFYGFWEFFINNVVPIIIIVWFWRKFKATPGKMLLRLEVVDARTGNRLSIKQAIGRNLAYIPATLVLGIGIIWIAIDKKKQGWHDKLAGTVVTREKSQATEKVTFEGNSGE